MQSSPDFKEWVDTYLKTHPEQPYHYRGKDVYAARCKLFGTVLFFSVSLKLGQVHFFIDRRYRQRLIKYKLKELKSFSRKKTTLQWRET
jgi:hypothetical protein